MSQSAKQIRVAPLSSSDTAKIVRAHHYSGKVVQNSTLHLGVWLGKRCGGAMSFGPPMNKRPMLKLVTGTEWHGMLELNRMAFADWLPRNSESRALSVAFRLIRKAYPQVKWILSFADGTQCGDGAIYRASGFLLTSIKRNTTLLRMPDGTVVADKTLNDHVYADGRRGSSHAKAAGATPLQGYQLQYIRFVDPTWRERLAVEPLPFSRIEELGAGMYRGRAKHRSDDAAGCQPEEGGSSPTRALQPQPQA